MARLSRELVEVLQLGPPVPFSKRMDVVDIAENFAGRRGESGGFEMGEEIRRTEPFVDVRPADFDETAKLEQLAALGDLDGADFARPIVQVLKQVTVNSAEVVEIEITSGRALGYALGHNEPLDLIQTGGVLQTQLVPEHRGPRINIGIVAAHSAANATAWARICARRCAWDQALRSNISNIAISAAFNGLPSIGCSRSAARRRLRLGDFFQ